MLTVRLITLRTTEPSPSIKTKHNWISEVFGAVGFGLPSFGASFFSGFCSTFSVVVFSTGFTSSWAGLSIFSVTVSIVSSLSDSIFIVTSSFFRGIVWFVFWLVTSCFSITAGVVPNTLSKNAVSFKLEKIWSFFTKNTIAITKRPSTTQAAVNMPPLFFFLDDFDFLFAIYLLSAILKSMFR